MRGGWGQQEPGHQGTGFTPFLNGPMPSCWQCRLGSHPTLCFPESGCCTMLERPAHCTGEDPGYTQGVHHPPRPLLAPLHGDTRLVQISRIFLVKLWAVCEESVARKRRSGKSAVVPRQKWQPHVTGRLRCAAA